jgi:thiol-disulfide isomerase/thioredoxin
MANSVTKVLVPLAIIIALVVGGLSFVKSQTASRKSDGTSTSADSGERVELAVGKELPEFKLTAFGGATKSVDALEAKVVLLNFWATWCEACMVEMPSIIKLREAYKGKGFEVIAVNVDQNPEAVLPKVIRKMGFTFPVYLDKDQALSEMFSIEAIPLTILLDMKNKRRKVLMLESGEQDWNGAAFRATLEKWLAG